MFNLADANVEIIIRDSELRDAGEIIKLISFECTLKLNEMSLWQIETQTRLFEKYGIDVGQGGIKNGIMFKRDGELLMSGPITDIKPTFKEGERKTTIFGCDDLYWLNVRDCYPVVTGPNLESDGNYYWSKKRGAVGIWSTTTEVVPAPELTATTLDIKVGSIIGYVIGAEVWAINPDEDIGTISAIDEANKTLSITLHLVEDETAPGNYIPTFLTELEKDCAIMQMTVPNNDIVDDPDFLGYDTRTGKAETVAKGLVYDNAAEGACTDQFYDPPSDSWKSIPRLTPYLHIAPDSGRGNEVTSNARGENLLGQITDICTSGALNFSVYQENRNLFFDVHNGRDLSKNDKLLFSVERRNLKGYEYQYGLPTSNCVMVYGSGMAARKMVCPVGLYDNILQYGRIEGWTNASSSAAGSTADVIKVNMIQSGNTFLAKNAQNASITAELWETEQVRFPRDFVVGDIVGVYIGNQKFPIPVTALHYKFPTAGDSSGSAVSETLSRAETNQMRQIKETRRDVSKLVKV